MFLKTMRAMHPKLSENNMQFFVNYTKNPRIDPEYPRVFQNILENPKNIRK